MDIVPTHAPCPRCGAACRVDTHDACTCRECFTSFRADAPMACLTAKERAALLNAVMWPEDDAQSEAI